MTVEVKGKNLVITIAMNEQLKESGSGKTLQVASSGGNQATKVEIEGKTLVVGVNAYIKK